MGSGWLASVGCPAPLSFSSPSVGSGSELDARDAGPPPGVGSVRADLRRVFRAKGSLGCSGSLCRRAVAATTAPTPAAAPAPAATLASVAVGRMSSCTAESEVLASGGRPSSAAVVAGAAGRSSSPSSSAVAGSGSGGSDAAASSGACDDAMLSCSDTHVVTVQERQAAAAAAAENSITVAAGYGCRLGRGASLVAKQ